MRTEWSICRKVDFFTLLDKKCVPKHPIAFHLKYIQDVFALSELKWLVESGRVVKNPVVGEVGANHSRVLSELTRYSDNLYAIDVYDRSIGGGYTVKPKAADYEIIECLIGDSKGSIADQFFDILFSVSVVENVPASMLYDFLIDHKRILRKGGVAIHLVDFYCDENGSQGGIVDALVRSFKRIDSDFACPIQDWAFHVSYCSNDDYTMWQWNKVAPSLKEKRANSQCCTFILKIYND